MANNTISPNPLASNNQGKPKVVSNTVGKKPGVKVPGKGKINPSFKGEYAGIAPAKPFLALNQQVERNPRRNLSLVAKSGGTAIPYRRAQEGNVGLPLGGMPPPPAQDSVSPEMVEEAKSLGIEVAPPGATAEEVADDQLVLLSEGELVVPANVVRYHGLAQYEKMRNAALTGLDEMQANGQIVSTQEDPMPEGLVKPQE